MALKNLVLILAFTCLLANAIATRDIKKSLIEFSSDSYENHHNIKPGYSLATRLEDNGGLMECWNALLELKSCTNEIVIFFLNGQADIGPGCCSAIDIITRNCWPAMLTSLGFTAEEGNILRGYCDASAGPVAAAPSPAGSAVIYQPQVSSMVLD